MARKPKTRGFCYTELATRAAKQKRRPNGRFTKGKKRKK